MKKNLVELEMRIERLLFLAVIFGVLWVKQYLWWAFFLAGLFYFWETLIAAAFRATLNSPPETTPRRRARPRRETLPPLPAWTKEDAETPPPGGGEDFREPPPGRSTPRKR